VVLVFRKKAPAFSIRKVSAVGLQNEGLTLRGDLPRIDHSLTNDSPVVYHQLGDDSSQQLRHL